MMTGKKKGGLASRKKKQQTVKVICFCVLCLCSLTVIMPLWFMVSTGLKSMDEIFSYPITWYPHHPVWSNFKDAWQSADFTKWFLNTTFVAAFAVAGGVLANSLVAYGFAKIRFPGKNLLFSVILATMMIPWQVTQVPLFATWSKMGLVNTFVPLVLPAFFGAPYYIYLCRQFIKGLPDSVIEASRIDGAGEFRILYQIVYPMCKPVLTTIMVLIFIAGWNDLNGPLLYLQSSEKYTLSIGLQMFLTGARQEWDLLMAASTLFTLPLIIIFFVAQKQFLGGISTTSGLK